MGVMFGAGERLVSQKGLDGSQICAILQEVRGKSMAQAVRCQLRRESKSRAFVPKPLLNDTHMDAFALCAVKNGMMGFLRERKFLAIMRHRLCHNGNEGNVSLIAAFADDAHGGGVHMMPIESRHFADTQSAAIKKHEDGVIASGNP